MDLFNLWKQIPNLEITQQEPAAAIGTETEEEFVPMIVDIEDINGVEQPPPETKDTSTAWDDKDKPWL